MVAVVAADDYDVYDDDDANDDDGYDSDRKENTNVIRCFTSLVWHGYTLLIICMDCEFGTNNISLNVLHKIFIYEKHFPGPQRRLSPHDVAEKRVFRSANRHVDWNFAAVMGFFCTKQNTTENKIIWNF